MSIIAYSRYDCYDACSNMSIHRTRSNQCNALTFQANMSNAHAYEVPPRGANCFLKNASDNDNTGGAGIVVGVIMQLS